MSLFVEGKFFKEAGANGGGGGSDPHNLGYYADLTALQTAHPTGEEGDFAILGSTDTIWVWDGGTSAWVDTDTKGQVTSVNNRTGAVTVSEVPDQTGYSGRVLGTDGFVAGWVVPEQVQRSTMPQADENEVGNIYQFTGTTDANYTNGYFYKCVSDGQEPATYSWTQTNVQPAPSGLPDQTGQNGKFLTTDGTDASWSDKPLVNNSTEFYAISIATDTTNPYVPASLATVSVGNGTRGSGANSVAVGNCARVLGYKQGNNYKSTGHVAIGYNAASGSTSSDINYGVAIGDLAYASESYTIAIGQYAQAGASGAIQLGSTQDGNYVKNLDTNTFKVANANGNFEIMSADGTVPTARLTKVNTTATLTVADWSNDSQTVTVSGVKADSVVFVSPDPTSASDYASAGILCTAQAADSLTFTCTTTPSNAITVNIVCL